MQHVIGVVARWLMRLPPRVALMAAIAAVAPTVARADAGGEEAPRRLRVETFVTGGTTVHLGSWLPSFARRSRERDDFAPVELREGAWNDPFEAGRLQGRFAVGVAIAWRVGERLDVTGSLEGGGLVGRIDVAGTYVDSSQLDVSGRSTGGWVLGVGAGLRLRPRADRLRLGIGAHADTLRRNYALVDENGTPVRGLSRFVYGALAVEFGVVVDRRHGIVLALRQRTSARLVATDLVFSVELARRRD